MADAPPKSDPAPPSQDASSDAIDLIGAFALVAETTREFANSRDLDSTLARALNLIVDQLGAEAGSLWLLDDAGTVLTCSASAGPNRITGMEVPVSKGIIGRRRIPDDSVAEIKASGLLGGYLISIREGSSSTYLEPGATIPSKQAADLLSTISDAADEINALIESSVRPLVDSVGQGIPEILGNLETFTQQLSQTMEQIDAWLAPKNTDRVGNILANLEATSAEAAQLTSGLGETRLQLDRVLATVDQLVSENKEEFSHTLADLHHSLESVARHIDAIASNLEVTTRNMNEFSRQLRQNAVLIVRGRSAGDGEAATP